MESTDAIRGALLCARSGCPCRSSLGNVHCPHHDPNHTDRTPSLNLGQGVDGTPLWKCFNGCSQDNVTDALQELGLWRKCNRQRQLRSEKGKKMRYEFRNPKGELVAIQVREDRSQGKRVWWEGPDGVNGLGGLKLADMPLYGVEELSTLPDGAQVVVTEGPPACDALRNLGIAAVGTAGASTTPGNDALHPFLRLVPVLWPDNDVPGRDHMRRIAARTRMIGCPNVLQVHWADAPPKGDAADAVAQSADVQGLIAHAAVWTPGNVDLASLLDDVVAFVRRYLVLRSDQTWTLALWTAHTYTLDAADCTPYISITSAEKRSGKTLLLEVLDLLVFCPWSTGRVSSAALVRKVARDRPTLLLDETDAAFKGDKEYSETLRGILNSGYRRGGVVSLCHKVGGDYEVQDFPVFGAKAIGGIGKLPDTIADRSIPIELCRKAPKEYVQRFRRRDAVTDASPLKERFEQWAAEAVPILEQARPDIPEELGDRAADVWEPLIAIADLSDGHWPEQARKAARVLSAESDQDDSLGVALLRAVREAFEEHGADRLSTAALVEHLVQVEEAPWGDLGRGKPLDARRMAIMLKPYGIAPKQIRLDPTTTVKGYRAADFEDSWDRYTPPGRETSETGKQMVSGQATEGGQDVSENGDLTETFTPGETPNVPDVSPVSLVSLPGDVHGDRLVL